MPISHSPKQPAEQQPEQQASVDENLGFDQILDRLRQVVQRLEQGNLPLEQALKAFEEGVRLSRRGSSILDTAEQRVELLLREENGAESRQPLGAASGPPESRSGEART